MNRKRPHLVIAGSPPDAWTKEAAKLPEVTDLHVARSSGEAEALLPEAEIVFWWHEDDNWLEKYWDRMTNLKWVQSSSAGVEKLLFPALAESPVVLTNGRGLYAQPLAEFVIFCALFFAKDFPRMERNRQARRWEPYEPLELLGQTMGIVGLGGTGRATARLAKAFGMTVLATKRNPESGAEMESVDEVISMGRWHDLLAVSDYVVNVLPLTAETRRLFGAGEFQAMKKSAFFINVGRGGTADEAALIEALKLNSIAGAGLDVTANEPLPAESELYTLPNVILSPHCADLTAAFPRRSARLFCDNVQRYLHGEPLHNVVDKRLGY